MVNAAADAAGLPRQLVAGVVETESGWDPMAVSHAGARGLMQVMPIWASPAYAGTIGMPGLTVDALMDPWTNLQAGTRILADELRRFGSWELAAMAYNAGAPAVMRAVSEAGTNDPAAVSAKLPAAETRSYWQKVMNWANVYAQKMGAAEAALENATVEVVENVKESGAIAPMLILALAALGLWLTVRR